MTQLYTFKSVPHRQTTRDIMRSHASCVVGRWCAVVFSLRCRQIQAELYDSFSSVCPTAARLTVDGLDGQTRQSEGSAVEYRDIEA